MFKAYKIITLYGKKVLYKNFRMSIHFMKTFNSLGIDKHTFDEALNQGIKGVVYHELETQQDYWVDIETIERYGFERNFGDYGLQVFLPLKYWTIKEKKSKKKELAYMR